LLLGEEALGKAVVLLGRLELGAATVTVYEGLGEQTLVGGGGGGDASETQMVLKRRVLSSIGDYYLINSLSEL